MRGCLALGLAVVLVGTGCAMSLPAASQLADPTGAPTSVSSAGTPTITHGDVPRASPAASRTLVAQPTPTGVLKAAPSGYESSSRELTKDERATMVGVSWRQGCPVPLSDLRAVTVTFVTFDGTIGRGTLVVNQDAVTAVRNAFGRLFAARFPIRQMRPIEAFGGDDFASIEADNTSSFNCRERSDSPGEFSQHSYGRAIDINPLENPYVNSKGRTTHPRSVPYLNRARPRPGLIVAGGPATAAFESVGWSWGGAWAGPIDYQHFSASGR